MTKATLYYYKATGKANMIRLALAAAGVEWEDVYPEEGFPPNSETKATWRAIGGNTTTNVPMLRMPDGKVYTQSSAVVKAVGRMGGGLMPATSTTSTDDYDLYLVDKLLDDTEDLRSAAYRSFVLFGASPDNVDSFVNEVLPLHLGNFDRMLGDGEYFIGSSLSVADICVYDVLTNYGSDVVPGVLDGFPRLKAFVSRVEGTPKIAAYIASAQYASIDKFSPALLGK